MKKLFLLPFLWLYLPCFNVSAQQLFPDNSFGTNGIVRNNFSSGYDDYYALRAQPNGGLIAGGLTTNFTQDIVIARYTSSGILDESFGNSGKYILDIQNSTEMLNFITIQPDNKILFVGHSIRSNLRRGILGRLNANGTPDDSFGDNGIIEFIALGTSSFTDLESVKLDADGSVYVTGTTLSGNLERAFVRKFTPSGTADSSFGNDGYSDVFFGLSNSRNYGFDLEVLPDGSVLMLGRYFVNRMQMGLAKFTPLGTLDNTFAGGGKTFFDFTTGQNYARRLLRLADNKFYALAYCNESGVSYNNYIGKFNEDGTPDIDYGTGGKFNFNTAADGNFVWDATLMNNEILLSDYSFLGSSIFSNVHLISENGTLANSFGNNGSFTLNGFTSYGQGVTFIGNEIFYAGAQYINESDSYNAFVRKLSNEGALDANFGINGVALASFSIASTSPVAMYQSASGEIFSVGTLRNNTSDQYVAKYNAQGALDASFGVSGLSVVNLGGTEVVKDVEVLANGQAVVIAERGLVTLNFTGLGNFSAPGNYSLIRIMPNTGFQTATATNTNINPNQFTRGLKVKEMPDGKLVVLATSTTANQRSGFLLRHNPDLTIDNSFGNQGNGRIQLNSLTNDEFFADINILADGRFITASSTFGGFRLRKVNNAGQYDENFGPIFSGVSEYIGQHTDGIDHLRAINLYQFNTGMLVLGIRGLANYAVAKVNNNGILNTYIALPGFKKVSGLKVEDDGSFTAFGVNDSDQWMLSKIDAQGNIINSFGDNGSFTLTVFNDITEAVAVMEEANGGFTLLSGQRSGVNGFDNTLLRLSPEAPSTSQNIIQAKLMLFPNPIITNNLSIKSSEQIGDVTSILLIDLKGKKIAIDQYNVENNIVKINLPVDLNPGLYFLEMNHKGGKSLLKFLKN